VTVCFPQNGLSDLFMMFSGVPTATQLSDRIPYIVFWARGYGQINRIPSVWNPEWVGCSFILFSDQTGRFSILWDDDSQYFRHSLEFEAYPLRVE